MRANRRVDVRVDHTGFGRQLWRGWRQARQLLNDSELSLF